MKKVENMSSAELARLIEQAECRRREIEAEDEAKAGDTIISFLGGRDRKSLIKAASLIESRKWREAGEELTNLITAALTREVEAERRRADRKAKTSQTILASAKGA